tara:strand:+ start:70 stop:192 length:123 start_codon:yes stop_codon:yes gene_type:complete
MIAKGKKQDLTRMALCQSSKQHTKQNKNNLSSAFNVIWQW